MNDTSFINAIRKSPDDDALRLSYADYLKHEGQVERSDFIRIQCALASKSCDNEMRRDLEQQERELLRRFGWEWAEEFGRDLCHWIYRRGFIEKVEIRLDRPSEKLINIVTRNPIRHIRDTSQIDDIGVLFTILDHVQLTGIEFWTLYGIQDEQIASLLSDERLSALKTLILHHDRNGRMISDDIIIEGLNSPLRSSLEEVFVCSDSMWRGPSTAVVEAIATSRFLQQLNSISLVCAELSPHAVAMLKDSSNLCHLERLDLGYCKAQSETWDQIFELLLQLNLQWVRLCETSITNRYGFFEARLVKSNDHLRQLQHINAEVDWDTEDITPAMDNCWLGMSWPGRQYQYLPRMLQLIRDGRIDKLESEFFELASATTGEPAASGIRDLPFEDLTDLTREYFLFAFHIASDKTQKKQASAIIVRYEGHSHAFRLEFTVDTVPPPSLDSVSAQ